jgi:glycerol-3-phosphate O-acyltransferase
MNAPEHPADAPRPSGLRRWIDRRLGGTRDHFRMLWPEAPGRIKGLLLRLFFSGVRLGDHQAALLKSLPAEAIPVYTTKFSCLFAFLFAATRYRELGLRPPRVAFGCRSWLWPPLGHLGRVLLANLDSLWVDRRRPDPFAGGGLARALLGGAAGFVSLIGRERRRPFARKPAVDPLEFLVDLQKSTERPVLMIPQLTVFSRSPRRAKPTVIDMLFGPEDEPGRLRRIAAVFKKPGNVFVEVSEPIDLREFIARPDIAGQASAYQAARLRAELLSQINRHHLSITGPVRKSRRELTESILSGEHLQRFMQAHAERHGLPFAAVRDQVSGYLDEIAADIRPGWILFYSGIIGFILRTMYAGVAMHPEEIAAVKRAALKGPVAFIPCHKSHVDYLILSYVLYHHDMPCPLVAAGRNLAFWPLGPLFRRGGAFYLRRSFKGAALYARTFAAYVHKVLEEGYNVEQFIEGGRSRTGKLLAPKLGLLAILLEAYQSGACRELSFVPVSIGYDQVLEEESYLAEIAGGQKRAESLVQFLKVPKFLKGRSGRIYLEIAEPISLKHLEAQGARPLAARAAAERAEFCRDLGQRIAVAITRRSVATPHALAAAAILARVDERITFAELVESAEIYLNHLFRLKARLADTLILDHRRALGQAVESYLRRGILEPDGARPAPPYTGGEGFRIKESRRPALDYYKNTAVAFFAPAALAATAILQQDAFQFSAAGLDRDYAFFEELFEREFVFDAETPAAVRLAQALEAFIDEAALMPHPELPETFNLTSAGFRKLRLFAMLTRALLESYWVAASALLPAEGAAEADRREAVKQIASQGARMLRRREIRQREALSKVAFENAAAVLRSRRARDGAPGMAADAAAIRRALRAIPA